MESQWQALAQKGVNIEVYTRGRDSYECRLYLPSGDEILFQDGSSTTVRWEKRFFVHVAQNKKEAKLEAKMYVLAHIKVLRVSSSTVQMNIADMLR